MVDWLRANSPPSPPPTLLHNDWRLDNIMLDADDPGRVEAVFDWDMCTLGDPLVRPRHAAGGLDARRARAWSGATAGTMPSNVPGFLTRREAVERYGARRGIDVGTVPYYYVFGLFKIAVVLQQIFHRYHLGQTKDRPLRVFDRSPRCSSSLAQSRSDPLSL